MTDLERLKIERIIIETEMQRLLAEARAEADELAAENERLEDALHEAWAMHV